MPCLVTCTDGEDSGKCDGYDEEGSCADIGHCLTLSHWQEFRKKIEDFSVMVTAERTGCINNETRPVNIVMKVYWSAITKTWWAKVAIGGVTGHESLMFELFAHRDRCDGWWACAGTKGSYDKLFVPKERIKEVVTKFKEATRDLLNFDN